MNSKEIRQRTPASSTTFNHLPESISRVLANRGIRSANEIDYSLKNLLPPTNLSGVSDAAELLAEAVTAGASVVVVGDFDADGATSCALAIKALRSFGLNEVSYLVPNRFDFGYGLTPEIVGVAATRQPDIIITVDNGISSIEGVDVAQQLGMTVLITDHHLPGDEIPNADVIVNPNLPGDRFASKNLAGVGVIFYVMLALRAELRKMGWFKEIGVTEPNMSHFLDLVALGTVADVVPLDGNNRTLVQQGLARIRQGHACAGIQALLNVGKRNPARIGASDLGFVVGPRLNAAGRLDDMSVGIECLLSEDYSQAMALAEQLDSLNKERREVEHTMQTEALATIEKFEVTETEGASVFVLYDEAWHQGIVGLVASRIKERTNRPVVALAPGDADGEWKGSARSVAGIHIRDVLARLDSVNPNLMKKFGGHAMAAGLSIDESKLEDFQSSITDVMNQITKGRDWSQVVWTDGELSVEEFTIEIAEQLRTLTPWGQEFQEPVFEGIFKVVEAKAVGDVHLKLRLQPMNANQLIDAICFSYFNTNDELPSGEIKAAYKLDVNEFRGNINVQLMVEHIEN